MSPQKWIKETNEEQENNGNIVLTDKIKVYILELPKIERMKSEDKNLNLWIKFIKDLEVKHMADNEEKDDADFNKDMLEDGSDEGSSSNYV